MNDFIKLLRGRIGGRSFDLKRDDDGQVLECVFCEMRVIQGSDDVMEAVIGQLKACGIEFEMLCETEKV